MKIFLTGASGFVGGAVTKQLRDNHTILAMSRSETSDEKINRLGIEPIRSSLGEVDPGQLDGIDAIIHCAAYVEEWGPYEAYHKINVDGTK
ncbi:MAG: NAD-dependent epimerase/dehydratase family protein, partial [Alphaproteobacteria bacterium]|nr:NAD-dependent epimerase/dehydratase family protein [Alphaproteobacteria bacterium]